jgi:Pyruvate/2-oxoacid:ferredoxin oxidoreductase delta subunit
MFRPCGLPINVCLDLNEYAERNIANQVLGAREITFDEALEVLEKSHEAGLVHVAYGHGELYESGVVNSICSCCSCCCGILSGVLRFGLFPHPLTSHAASVTDVSSCTDCGESIDGCQFGARRMLDGALFVDRDFCFGCGLCVSSCPAGAVSLIDRYRAEVFAYCGFSRKLA